MNDAGSVALNDVNAFRLISGLWKGKREPFVHCAVLRSTDFRGDGLLNYRDAAEFDVEDRQSAQRELVRGDIIIERSGGGPKQPVGRVGYFDPPDSRIYCTSNFTTAIRVIDTTAFDSKYVSLFLHALYLSGATEALQRATTGIRNLDWHEYLNFRVPKPTLQVQEEVTRAVDGIRRAYLIEERQFDLFLNLKRAAMRELFTRGLRGEAQKQTKIGPVPKTWEVVAFASVREWLQYGTSVRCNLKPAKYPVLRIPNIEPGYVNIEELKYCDLPSGEANKYRLQRGDLIFIRTNGVVERLGSCAVYDDEPRDALFASYLIRARLRPDLVEPRFAAHFFGSSRGTDLVAGRATPAADGKYNLNTGTIDALPLPLPPTVDEQREIVAILDAIDRKIDLHKRKKAVLEELFKALLHELMTGEIRVADLDLSALNSTVNAAEATA